MRGMFAVWINEVTFTESAGLAQDLHDLIGLGN
jgi:hypothetical protein